MTHVRIGACLALLLALPATAAESPCNADARRLCPDVPIGGGGVLQCLREQWYQVSSGCQSVIQDFDARARQIDVSCQSDLYQYCQSALFKGRSQAVSCLARRWDRLSSTCQDAVGRIAEKLQRFADACRDDAGRLCPGVEPGGGRLFACLKLQERAVTSRCAAAMSR
jgi:hypothetical protein